jgi:RNA 3'-phosphate cyclase
MAHLLLFLNPCENSQRRRGERFVIEIDGSEKGGSGTILRLSVAFSAVIQEPVHIFNIRENRPEPGLKPQHLEAVLTAARLCNADVKGAEIDSREIWFKPNSIMGGRFEAEIGTAGSIPMLLMTVLPICIQAREKVELRISKGGTDVSHSPTINYIRFVLLPVLHRMGLTATLQVEKYGYYPKGMGEVRVSVEPCKNLKPLCLERFGAFQKVHGVSVCTFLADRKVAARQADAAAEYLSRKGVETDIQVVNDKSNSLQKGSSMTLWIETDTGVILGSDAIGELKKTSEAVGREAAEKLLAEVSTQSTVDIHLADLLVPYMALSQGNSSFLTRMLTEHLQTNIWLSERMLNVHFSVTSLNGLYKIEKHS